MPSPAPATSSPDRQRLLRLIGHIQPWDEREHTDLERARDWINGTADLYRTTPPDVPPIHLVAYFVVLDPARGRLLLVAHRKAGLWLPTGGHVEPAEDPWAAVTRECVEELGAVPLPEPRLGSRPLFLTWTTTRGPGTHTDVSLWYVVTADPAAIRYDEQEFTEVDWFSPERIHATPIEDLDPESHRFTRKLLATVPLPVA